MTRRGRIVAQGVAALVASTAGVLMALAVVGPRPVALESRTVALELEARPEARPTAEHRRQPAKEPPPPAAGAGLEKPGQGAGLLEGIVAKMIENAIATFWAVVQALILAITLRRYAKAG